MDKILYEETKANESVQVIGFYYPLWETYKGAGGCITKLVESMMAGDQEALEILCENLSHQLSFYKATYLAVPYMVKLLAKYEEEKNIPQMLYLISNLGIILGTEFENLDRECEEQIYEVYKNSKEILREKVKRFLSENIEDLFEFDDEQGILSMLVCGLPAIMGEEDITFLLLIMACEQCCIMCESCEYVEETDIYDEELEIEPLEIDYEQWNGKDFNNTVMWLGYIAEKIYPELLESLPIYFGTYTCPECGNKGKVLDLMKKYFTEE